MLSLATGYEMKIKEGLPISLNDQTAHLLPTPLAHDAHAVSASDYQRHTLPLSCVAGGSLNPEWVEWLMGFPKDWTKVN